MLTYHHWGSVALTATNFTGGDRDIKFNSRDKFKKEICKITVTSPRGQCVKRMPIFVVRIEPADGLNSSGARISACAVMPKIMTHIHKGPTLERLTLFTRSSSLQTELFLASYTATGTNTGTTQWYKHIYESTSIKLISPQTKRLWKSETINSGIFSTEKVFWQFPSE